MRRACPTLCAMVLFTAAGYATPPLELFNNRDFAGWEFIATPATDINAVCRRSDVHRDSDPQPYQYRG